MEITSCEMAGCVSTKGRRRIRTKGSEDREHNFLIQDPLGHFKEERQFMDKMDTSPILTRRKRLRLGTPQSQ